MSALVCKCFQFRTEFQTLKETVSHLAQVDQQVVDRIEELKTQVATLKVRIAELELQLQASLATTRNGVSLLVWLGTQP